ncbi:MAG: copper homeostasis protein CutC [Gemmatimonadaceae bacterium]
MKILLEAAVESLDDALAAVAGGADRLELCANLSVGGTTPAQALIADVAGGSGVPVLAMIRPRGGSFVYSATEIDGMKRDVEMALDSGAAGVVLGVLDERNRVDVTLTQSLAKVAGAERVTFHRACDRTPDLGEAVDALISIGIPRVLTSGGAATAIEGAAVLAALVARVGDRLCVLAGGGVRSSNVREVIARTGVREVHARCERDAERIRAISDAVRGAT